MRFVYRMHSKYIWISSLCKFTIFFAFEFISSKLPNLIFELNFNWSKTNTTHPINITISIIFIRIQDEKRFSNFYLITLVKILKTWNLWNISFINLHFCSFAFVWVVIKTIFWIFLDFQKKSILTRNLQLSEKIKKLLTNRIYNWITCLIRVRNDLWLFCNIKKTFPACQDGSFKYP